MFLKNNGGPKLSQERRCIKDKDTKVFARLGSLDIGETVDLRFINKF